MARNWDRGGLNRPPPLRGGAEDLKSMGIVENEAWGSGSTPCELTANRVRVE